MCRSHIQIDSVCFTPLSFDILETSSNGAEKASNVLETSSNGAVIVVVVIALLLSLVAGILLNGR